MDFSKHDQFGNFLYAFGDDVPAGIISGEDVLPLEDSGNLSGIFMLSDSLLLGYDIIWKSYHPDFVAAGWRQNANPFPMALWNARTGKKRSTLHGLHMGSPRGAKLIDDRRLITWARDFQVFLWDIETGERLAEFTTPVLTDEHGYSAVTSRNGESFTADDWLNYIEGQSVSGFNVTIYLKTDPDAPQNRCGPYNGLSGKDVVPRRYQPNQGKSLDNSDLMRRMRDLEEVEASYATQFRLSDGRFGVGGATHGAWEQVFVWDGLKDLSILIPNRLDTNCKIDGEVDPNTIRIVDDADIYLFKDI
ncbi:hypothetical protein [Hyphococcus sp. DH-69]|uniref:hypothetical protein n=1 Tax=Hyphococcus formosus TaxID=3143534 RepID=UPI00398B072B